MSDQKINIEEVAKQLRYAFGNSSFFSSERQLNHSECVRLYSELLTFKPEDTPFFLGHILLDLLYTHSGCIEDSFGVLSVFRFLNFDNSSDAGALQATVQHKEQVKKFLTRGQKFAIHQWVALASLWPELQVEDQDAVNATVEYWRKESELN